MFVLGFPNPYAINNIEPTLSGLVVVSIVHARGRQSGRPRRSAAAIGSKSLLAEILAKHVAGRRICDLIPCQSMRA